jgi:hypothetical protein
VRIALWSGPRNLSTALMRSFGSRRDTVVVDEPFYGHYLSVTGRRHPGAEEVLAHCETDADRVAQSLAAPLPGKRSICYQKQMAHHLLPGVPRTWLDDARCAFLIREPAAVLTSLAQHLTEITVMDTGLPQQVELFSRQARRLGAPPPVIDSTDLLANPEAILRGLCRALCIPFDPAMLAWEAGPRSTDGIWGPHWYTEVYQTTGFVPERRSAQRRGPQRRGPQRRGPQRRLPEHLQSVLEECLPFHRELAAHKLLP